MLILKVPYLEGILTSLRSNKCRNNPLPYVFNVNGISAWYSREHDTYILWRGSDHTGLAYKESKDGRIGIFPYYRGYILKETEVYRLTDLHKPRTEDEFLTVLYKQAFSINEECKHVATVGGFIGSFEDYMFRVKPVLHWLSYFNSTVTI